MSEKTYAEAAEDLYRAVEDYFKPGADFMQTDHALCVALNDVRELRMGERLKADAGALVLQRQKADFFPSPEDLRRARDGGFNRVIVERVNGFQSVYHLGEGQ